MCRLLAFAMNRPNSKGIRVLNNVINAMAKCSTYDPYLKHLSKRGHDDGWGYTIVVKDGNKVIEEYYYRSVKAMWQDERNSSFLKGILKSRFESKIVYGIIHIRLASPGEKVSLENTHPFRFITRRFNNILYLAHNGSLDKVKLADILGLKGDIISRLSDSYLLGLYLSENIELQELKERYKYLIDSSIVKTALNTTILYVSKGDITLYVTVYYKDRREYYKLYKFQDEGLTLYASSSIIDFYLDKELKDEWIEIPNNFIGKVIIE